MDRQYVGPNRCLVALSYTYILMQPSRFIRAGASHLVQTKGLVKRPHGQFGIFLPNHTGDLDLRGGYHLNC